MKHDLWYCGELIYDFGDELIGVTRLFVSEKDKTERVNPREHECRVWEYGIKRGFSGSYNGTEVMFGTYDECKAYYDRHKRTEYLELQVRNRRRSYGCHAIESNEDQAFYDARLKYSEWLEKLDEMQDPFTRSGMSIHDFI